MIAKVLSWYTYEHCRMNTRENVNVSFMSVGRIAPRKQAIMAIGFDEQPKKETFI